MKELGSAHSIISKISTTIDGGARLTLDFSAQDKELIKSLLELYLKGEKEVFVAFVKDNNNLDF